MAAIVLKFCSREWDLEDVSEVNDIMKKVHDDRIMSLEEAEALKARLCDIELKGCYFRSSDSDGQVYTVMYDLTLNTRLGEVIFQNDSVVRITLPEDMIKYLLEVSMERFGKQLVPYGASDVLVKPGRLSYTYRNAIERVKYILNNYDRYCLRKQEIITKRNAGANFNKNREVALSRIEKKKKSMTKDFSKINVEFTNTDAVNLTCDNFWYDPESHTIHCKYNIKHAMSASGEFNGYRKDLVKYFQMLTIKMPCYIVEVDTGFLKEVIYDVNFDSFVGTIGTSWCPVLEITDRRLSRYNECLRYKDTGKVVNMGEGGVYVFGYSMLPLCFKDTIKSITNEISGFNVEDNDNSLSSERCAGYRNQYGYKRNRIKPAYEDLDLYDTDEYNIVDVEEIINSYYDFTKLLYSRKEEHDYDEEI